MAEMDIYPILEELRAELDRLDHVIRTVEALSVGRRRRGRTPKFMKGDPQAGRKRPASDNK